MVDCPTDVALERLLSQRGFDRADAEARIRSQISREERVKEADYVLDNSGDRAALEVEVDKLWDWLLAARGRSGGPRPPDPSHPPGSLARVMPDFEVVSPSSPRGTSRRPSPRLATGVNRGDPTRPCRASRARGRPPPSPG